MNINFLSFARSGFAMYYGHADTFAWLHPQRLRLTLAKRAGRVGMRVRTKNDSVREGGQAGGRPGVRGRVHCGIQTIKNRRHTFRRTGNDLEWCGDNEHINKPINST